MGVLPGRVTQVEFGVAGQPGVGEVGRPGQHRRQTGMFGDERFAVQEPVRKTADLHPPPALSVFGP